MKNITFVFRRVISFGHTLVMCNGLKFLGLMAVLVVRDAAIFSPSRRLKAYEDQLLRMP